MSDEELREYHVYVIFLGWSDVERYTDWPYDLESEQITDRHRPVVYIGMSSNLFNRMKDHKRKKTPHVRLIRIYGPYDSEAAKAEEARLFYIWRDKGYLVWGEPPEPKDYRGWISSTFSA